MDKTTFGPQTARTIYDRVIANPPRGTATPGMQMPTVDPGAPIRFRNGSNETVPAFACMKVTGAELDTNTNRYVVIVSKPDGTGGDFRFNGPYEVEAGGYGSCYLGIVKAAYVTGNTPTLGQYWGPVDTWEVEPSGTPAIRVLGDLENDQLFGMALDGDPVTVKVVPDNDVNPGGSSSCTVYAGQPPVATTQSIPAVYLDWESGEEQISAGKQARAIYEPSDGVWRFISAECETDEEAASKIGTGTSLPSEPTTYSMFVLFHGTDEFTIYENDGAGSLTAVSESATAPA